MYRVTKFVDKRAIPIMIIGAVVALCCPLGGVLIDKSRLVSLLASLGILSIGLSLVFIPVYIVERNWRKRKREGEE